MCLCEAKYLFLINKQISTSLNHLNDSKSVIGYSNHMNDTFRRIQILKNTTQTKFVKY